MTAEGPVEATPPPAPVDSMPAAPAPADAAPAAARPPQPETTAAMFDVHPLRHAATGWREFLVHIATIAVGLLLALGLEQFASYVHHRLELRDARRELALELEGNAHIMEMNRAWLEKLAPALAADSALLRATPAPPGNALHFPAAPAWPPDGAWQTAKRSGSIGLMPHDELDRYTYFYETVQAIKDSLPPLMLQVERAEAVARRSADAPLGARDVEALLDTTAEAQARLAYVAAVLHYESRGLELARGRH
jgi:hypothetical protein